MALKYRAPSRPRTHSPKGTGNRSLPVLAEMDHHPSDPAESKDSSKPQDLQRAQALRWSGIGFEYLVAVALFGWLGWKLDHALGLDQAFPAFLLLGLFLGIGFGTYRMALLVRSVERSSKPSSEEPDDPAKDSRPSDTKSP